VLDLACGDAGAARSAGGSLLGRGCVRGDGQGHKRRGATSSLGDLNDYEPPGPVAATTCFRAIYYANDRQPSSVASPAYTELKFVFDLNPRQYRRRGCAFDLRAAGLDQLELTSILLAAAFATATGGQRALCVERSGPLARLLLAVRFSYLCAALPRRQEHVAHLRAQLAGVALPREISLGTKVGADLISTRKGTGRTEDDTRSLAADVERLASVGLPRCGCLSSPIDHGADRDRGVPGHLVWPSVWPKHDDAHPTRAVVLGRVARVGAE
jgi:hypothetical protein